MPTSVLPVNESLRTLRLPVSAAPATLPSPVMILTTPAGKMLAIILPSSSVESEAFSSAFSTTVLPVTSAGASLNAAMIAGAFQGIICPQTPSGSRFARL